MLGVCVVDSLEDDWKLVCGIDESVEKLCHPPTELEPMPHTSVALTAQYLNVRQRKLGTIIIQTVHILQHDSADTGSLPLEDFFKHNPNYFEITLPDRVPLNLRTNGGGSNIV